MEIWKKNTQGRKNLLTISPGCFPMFMCFLFLKDDRMNSHFQSFCLLIWIICELLLELKESLYPQFEKHRTDCTLLSSAVSFLKVRVVLLRKGGRDYVFSRHRLIRWLLSDPEFSGMVINRPSGLNFQEALWSAPDVEWERTIRC